MDKNQLNCEFGMCIKDVFNHDFNHGSTHVAYADTDSTKDIFNHGSTHVAYADTDSTKDGIVSIDINSLYSALEYMSEEELEELWSEE